MPQSYSSDGRDQDTVEYVISAFGKDYKLEFERNNALTPLAFRATFRYLILTFYQQNSY